MDKIGRDTLHELATKYNPREKRFIIYSITLEMNRTEVMHKIMMDWHISELNTN